MCVGQNSLLMVLLRGREERVCAFAHRCRHEKQQVVPELHVRQLRSMSPPLQLLFAHVNRNPKGSMTVEPRVGIPMVRLQQVLAPWTSWRACTLSSERLMFVSCVDTVVLALKLPCGMRGVLALVCRSRMRQLLMGRFPEALSAFSLVLRSMNVGLYPSAD